MSGKHVSRDPRCPLRPNDPCTLCQINVTGPQDCGLVYLMMNDEDLQEIRRQKLRDRRDAANRD